MSIELRLGRWEDVLSDVLPNAVIVDPPYGSRTHAGNSSMRERFGSAERRSLSYACWQPNDVRAFISAWSPRCSGWIAGMTSDDLIPVWREAAESEGRYAFAPVPIIQPRVRLGGDGPASSAVYLMVSRPRERRFLGWGALPGWYQAGINRSGHIGGKPMALMRAIVRDYSRPGDTVCDPCAGYGTTLRAAETEGRKAIGAEIDPATHRAAVQIGGGKPEQPTLFGVTR